MEIGYKIVMVILLILVVINLFMAIDNNIKIREVKEEVNKIDTDFYDFVYLQQQLNEVQSDVNMRLLESILI